MVKYLIILFCLVTSSSLIAQQTQSNGNVSRMASSVIWSDDFSDTSKWVITNAPNIIGEWTFDTIIPGNLIPFMPSRLNTINSDFGQGNFAIINSDFYKYGVQQNSNLTTKNSIDLSTQSNVRLVFNQYYKGSVDLTRVDVSTDLNTWTPFVINDNYEPGYITANPNRVSIDISSVAGNQSAVWLRFHYEGSWDYAWMIDDLVIEEIPAVDVETFDVQFFNYYDGMASCSVVQDNLTIGIRNVGASDIFNIAGDACFVVNNGIPIVEAVSLEDPQGNPITSLAIGDSAYYIFSTSLNTAFIGNNKIQAFIKIIGDSYAGNDTSAIVNIKKYDSYDATANDYTMGFENGEDFDGWVKMDVDRNDFSWQVSSVGGRAGSSRCLKIINNPDAFQNGNTGIADDWAISGCIGLQANHQYELSYYARLTTGYACNLEVKYGFFQFVNSLNKVATPLFTVLDSGVYMHFSNIISISSTDDYYFGFHALNTDSALGVALRIDDIKVKDVTNVTAINNIVDSKTITIYPNPAKDIATIDGLSASNSIIKIKDVLGKEIQTIPSNGKSQLKIDMANFTHGIYFISIIDNETLTITTKKLVIQ